MSRPAARNILLPLRSILVSTLANACQRLNQSDVPRLSLGALKLAVVTEKGERPLVAPARGRELGRRRALRRRGVGLPSHVSGATSMTWRGARAAGAAGARAGRRRGGVARPGAEARPRSRRACSRSAARRPPSFARSRESQRRKCCRPPHSSWSHPLGLGDAQQALELLAGARGVAIGGAARVQPDLVAAAGDPADHERAHPGILEEVGAVARAVVAMGEEVEGAAQSVALADVHEEVERVVGSRRRSPRTATIACAARQAAGRAAARDRRRAGASRPVRCGRASPAGRRRRASGRPRTRAVCVAGGASPLQGLPQQLDVRVDDRVPRKPARVRDRRRSREAPVPSRSGTTSSS